MKRSHWRNVLYVPNMNKCLRSGDLFENPGNNSVYKKLGKFVLTRSGIFVGKGYSSERIVKLCIVDNDSNKLIHSNM